MLEKSIRTDVKKLVNQRRALFQNNTIKLRKIKKEISNNLTNISKDSEEKPKTIRNIKGSFFNSNNSSQQEAKNIFPPKEISSLKFQQEIISDIENVNLFGNETMTYSNGYNNNKINNNLNSNNIKAFVKTSASQTKKPFRLNPLKLSRMQKKVLKIDDFILLESELPNIFLSEANKFNLNNQQLKEFNKQLIQELKKLNVFAQQSPKVQVASFSKKLINKKAYKTYDKVLGDKFKLDFLTNKMSVRQNSLKALMHKGSNISGGSKEDSFTYYKTGNSNSVSVENENFNIVVNTNYNKNNNYKDKNFLKNLSNENHNNNNNNKNKKTYLTAFDALDSIKCLNDSDSESNANALLSENIKLKLEKFSKHIQTENTQSNNTSMEQQPKDKNKDSLFINNSRKSSSNNSRSRARAKSNGIYNTVNNYSGKTPVINRKGKNDKSFLDNYIRLPKIVVSKINVGNTTSSGNMNNAYNNSGRNSFSNSYRNYVANEVVLGSKELLKGFNKTKKARYNLDSLVSKISYKVGNGFPLKKYITNYDSFSNVYPKKNFAK